MFISTYCLFQYVEINILKYVYFNVTIETNTVTKFTSKQKTIHKRTPSILMHEMI